VKSGKVSWQSTFNLWMCWQILYSTFLKVTNNIGVDGFLNVQQEIIIAWDMVVHRYYDNVLKTKYCFEQEVKRTIYLLCT
jgi:hypothetical protein